MLKYSLGVLLAAMASSAFAAGPDFGACQSMFYQGFAPTPTSTQPGKLRALCFNGFAVLHSGQSKTPVYSAEYLTRERLISAKGGERTDKFYPEARLPAAERATLADYKNSATVHFDRGHQSPAGDMDSAEAMAQSFSLANMVPQAPAMNRGVWAKSVEKATRNYAMRATQGLYVITGPIYRAPVSAIGPGQVWVPAALFKLDYDPAKRKAWVYIVDNTDSATVTGVYSYQDLVKATGMEFLPAGAVQ